MDRVSHRVAECFNTLALRGGVCWLRRASEDLSHQQPVAFSRFYNPFLTIVFLLFTASIFNRSFAQMDRVSHRVAECFNTLALRGGVCWLRRASEDLSHQQPVAFSRFYNPFLTIVFLLFYC